MALAVLLASGHLVQDRRLTLLQGEEAQHLQEQELQHLPLLSKMGQQHQGRDGFEAGSTCGLTQHPHASAFAAPAPLASGKDIESGHQAGIAEHWHALAVLGDLAS